MVQACDSQLELVLWWLCCPTASRGLKREKDMREREREIRDARGD